MRKRDNFGKYIELEEFFKARVEVSLGEAIKRDKQDCQRII
jgi:hypothetical protein